jgi:hypothetical protein
MSSYWTCGYSLAVYEAPVTKRIRRALIEIGFIIFLFYANLLMGEFTHSGVGRHKSLAWAVHDIFTGFNFTIAVTAAIIGYLVFEMLRKSV